MPARGAERCEICVLGGGPAGAVTAMRLAELGRDVMLVERGQRRRAVRAESLAPSILPLLDSLGLRDRVEQAAYLREARALVDWAPGGSRVRSYDAVRPLLVERAQFDPLLREAAVDAGARLMAPATAYAPQRGPTGGWLVPMATGEGPTALRAAFLVDARGRRSGGSVRAGGDAPRTASLSGGWAIDDCGLVETRIEAGDDEWLWGSPLPGNRYAATVFLDPERIAGFGAGERVRLYRNILAGSRLLRSLPHSRQIGPIQVCDATARRAIDMIERDFIRVGEAAFSIDPISSQGIQAAIISAVQGAAAVHTLLTDRDDPAPALDFYRERQRAAAARSALTARRQYGLRAVGGASPFWLSRARSDDTSSMDGLARMVPLLSLPADLCLSPKLRIAETPVLVGPLIRRAPALHHPNLPEPVAYFGGINVAVLAGEIATIRGRDRILEVWAGSVPHAACRQIMNWMYQVGLVVRPFAPSSEPMTAAPPIPR